MPVLFSFYEIKFPSGVHLACFGMLIYYKPLQASLLFPKNSYACPSKCMAGFLCALLLKDERLNLIFFVLSFLPLLLSQSYKFSMSFSEKCPFSQPISLHLSTKWLNRSSGPLGRFLWVQMKWWCLLKMTSFPVPLWEAFVGNFVNVNHL